MEREEIVIPDEDRGERHRTGGFTRLMSRKSEGGTYIAVGFVFLILSGTLAAMPGGYWPVTLVAFGFSFYGLVIAKGALRRVCGVVIAGASGGACLGDFLVFLADGRL